MQSEQQQRIMGYFIEEAKDHLNTIEQGLLSLQSTIADSEMINEVFRAAHSVKGGAAMLGLNGIQQTSHRLEDYFKVLKECPIKVDQKLETLFLRVFDTLQELLENLQGPFGLTDEKAAEVMAEVEPVFTELNAHLSILVTQSGGVPPEDVSLTTPPIAATVPSAQPKAPSVTQEESALKLIFQSDVPVHLREMLQLFKQPDQAESRQQLQDLCRMLSQAGEQFDMPQWCDLIEQTRRAIANPDNTYRTLAPIVIKEIKRSQELVLTGNFEAIACSDALRALLPIGVGSEPEALDFADFLTVELGDGGDATDLLELDWDDSGTDDSEVPSLDLAENDDWFNEATLSQADELVADMPDFSFEELASGEDSDGILSDFELPEALFEESPFEESLFEPQADQTDQIEELDFSDFESPAVAHPPTGPEVGMAELNSLADLFEGEFPDLRMAWQQEEAVGEPDPVLNDSLGLDEPGDFSDLLEPESAADLSLELEEDEEDLSAFLNRSERLANGTEPLASADEVIETMAADAEDFLLELESEELTLFEEDSEFTLEFEEERLEIHEENGSESFSFESTSVGITPADDQDLSSQLDSLGDLFADSSPDDLIAEVLSAQKSVASGEESDSAEELGDFGTLFEEEANADTPEDLLDLEDSLDLGEWGEAESLELEASEDAGDRPLFDEQAQNWEILEDSPDDESLTAALFEDRSGNEPEQQSSETELEETLFDELSDYPDELTETLGEAASASAPEANLTASEPTAWSDPDVTNDLWGEMLEDDSPSYVDQSARAREEDFFDAFADTPEVAPTTSEAELAADFDLFEASQASDSAPIPEPEPASDLEDVHLAIDDLDSPLPSPWEEDEEIALAPEADAGLLDLEADLSWSDEITSEEITTDSAELFPEPDQALDFEVEQPQSSAFFGEEDNFTAIEDTADTAESDLATLFGEENVEAFDLELEDESVVGDLANLFDEDTAETAVASDLTDLLTESAEVPASEETGEVEGEANLDESLFGSSEDLTVGEAIAYFETFSEEIEVEAETGTETETDLADLLAADSTDFSLDFLESPTSEATGDLESAFNLENDSSDLFEDLGDMPSESTESSDLEGLFASESTDFDLNFSESEAIVDTQAEDDNGLADLFGGSTAEEDSEAAGAESFDLGFEEQSAELADFSAGLFDSEDESEAAGTESFDLGFEEQSAELADFSAGLFDSEDESEAAGTESLDLGFEEQSAELTDFSAGLFDSEDESEAAGTESFDLGFEEQSAELTDFSAGLFDSEDESEAAGTESFDLGFKEQSEEENAELTDFSAGLFASEDESEAPEAAGTESFDLGFEEQSTELADFSAGLFDSEAESEAAGTESFDLGFEEQSTELADFSAGLFDSEDESETAGTESFDLGFEEQSAELSDFSAGLFDSEDEPEAGAENLDFNLELETEAAIEEQAVSEDEEDGDLFDLGNFDLENLEGFDNLETSGDLSSELDGLEFDLPNAESTQLTSELFTDETESESDSLDLDFDLELEQESLAEDLTADAQGSEINDLEESFDLDFMDLTESAPSEATDLLDFSQLDLEESSATEALELGADFDFDMELAESTTETTADFTDDFTDDFADLDELLIEPPASAEHPPSMTSLTESSIASEDDDFADLEALLETDSISGFGPDDVPISSIPVEAETVDEFDDLEKLLEDADQNLGGTPTAKGVRRPSLATGRRMSRRGPGVLGEQNMRVSVKHLDNLNNLVGELVVNRNSLEQAQERLRQFLDNLLYQAQQLSDVGQRMRDLYERSLLESSLLSSRKSYQLSPFESPQQQQSHSTGLSFDALEMDRFTGFHTLSQEMIELIVRVRESASDIDFVVDETDQITRTFRQITTQLQEGLTRSRMVPFAQTADRLPRAVRDISIKYGKQAELSVEGRDTLIDKMILEQLYDPMTHLVNNAITHGIEPPVERTAAGKSPTGRITIRTFHQGNQTVISVIDDGAGIDPEYVKSKAIARGLITRSEAASMTHLDVYDLLFHHGFSTKDQADDFAGRGVGMDVVRTSLNEIRGVISIDSTIGKGTTFTIRLPLTLSISKALCCISNRARIAFPMDGVEDMLDVPNERVQTNEEGQSCIFWRDTLLPFQPLADLLKYNRSLSRGSVYGGNQEDDIISVVVLRSAGNFLALQVDQVLGEQEIVIKQLEGPVPKPVGIAGATVLGDGRIMPIADVLELIDLSLGRIRREAGNALWEKDGDLPVEPANVKTEPTVLIVDDSITVRELLSMTFSKIGYRVEQARDGQEAWEKLRSGLPCDLVFCDIEMPRMDGLELLSRIQKDPNLQHLPIAMLTSRGADRHRQMAVQLGAKGYFTKPYLEEALLDAAQRMLRGEVLVTSSSTLP